MLLLTFLALGFRFIRGTYAAVEVRTIDDQYGDSATGALPVYLPSGEWTYGPTCGTQCYIGQSKYVVFNTSAIFNGSWHDTTFRENQPQKYISLSFTGTSISVYCIVLNTVPSLSTGAYYNFSLDGGPGVSYTHSPDSSSTILYNTKVYSVSGLANVAHTLEMAPMLYQNHLSLMLFDYATYTYEDSSPEVSSTGAISSPPSPTPSSAGSKSTSSPGDSGSTPSVGIITGAVAGGVLLITGALLVLWRIMTRRRRKRLTERVTGQGDSLDSRNFPADDAMLYAHPYPIGSSKKKLAAPGRTMPVSRRPSADDSRSLVQLELRSLPSEKGILGHTPNIDDDARAVARDARLLQLHEEISRLRAEIPNVQLLQAEIDRLRATYEEEAPPTYSTAG